MSNTTTYKDSGVLELFVTGNLPEQESTAVAQEVLKSSELTREVEEIEAAVMHLARAAAPQIVPIFSKIKSRLNLGEGKVIPLSRKQSSSSWIGWAAALLLLAGLGYFYVQNQELEQQLVDVQREQLLQEGKTQVAEESLVETENLLNIIRSKDILQIPLGGQKVDPNAFAQVYWDKENNKAYIDVRGLPVPPEGKVYQVWSLKLEPLTPTNLGILDEYDASGLQIFELDNANASEAFGITLEPAGGSPGPNLEQLYTLGVVQS